MPKWTMSLFAKGKREPLKVLEEGRMSTEGKGRGLKKIGLDTPFPLYSRPKQMGMCVCVWGETLESLQKMTLPPPTPNSLWFLKHAAPTHLTAFVPAVPSTRFFIQVKGHLTRG